ncbi:xyloglucan endotransglucosylase protein 1-like [Rosa rugosa]|uniref:xyloglucan endotransglucosylase protein 1-like n=1 Tax=Rosa rugosa TaxID=74645 RepID=UPI002B418028|nr:xyloglucan endotransglucosylase protein 1-like [Rosa rugosa]
MSSCNIILSLSLFITCVTVIMASASNFYQDFHILFGDQRAQILDGGQLLTLSQDQTSGSGFISQNQYLFGRFDMQMKLAPGNTAGTVTTFYLSSSGYHHDEIDLEFLGNTSGNPYTLSTNIYTQGIGGREQQFHLWFDPSKDFHTYSVVWNVHRIIILVDNSPIRVFNNLELLHVPFPKSQPMTIYASLWDGDSWATQGGRVKTDWSQAPFTASYGRYNINACLGSQQQGSSSSSYPYSYTDCVPTSTNSSNVDNSWRNLGLNAAGRNRLRWVQTKFMIYNYCTDRNKFPGGLPRECQHSKF